MARELTWREAIDKVLATATAPLHYKEIATRIIADGLRTNLGATPAAAVNARISALMKHAAVAPYVRVAKGTLALAPATTFPVKPETASPDAGESISIGPEKHCDIATSFGLHWLRDAVRWGATPKLLGMKYLGSAPVDFNKQAGLYLLCDGREIVYIGRATERRLGEQLFAHTIDRLAARWDRFSWFGLRPVTGDGQLGALPASYDADKVILVLQAILVEAVEPRQNRRHGEDLSTLEFIQCEDPEIKRTRGSRPRPRQSWK